MGNIVIVMCKPYPDSIYQLFTSPDLLLFTALLSLNISNFIGYTLKDTSLHYTDKIELNKRKKFHLVLIFFMIVYFFIFKVINAKYIHLVKKLEYGYFIIVLVFCCILSTMLYCRNNIFQIYNFQLLSIKKRIIEASKTRKKILSLNSFL